MPNQLKTKYINVKVSACISTDFFIEVPEETPAEQIRVLAENEVKLPHQYPSILDNFLKTRMGIQVHGLDSMLKAWDIDDIKYIIDNESHDRIGYSVND